MKIWGTIVRSVQYGSLRCTVLMDYLWYMELVLVHCTIVTAVGCHHVQCQKLRNYVYTYSIVYDVHHGVHYRAAYKLPPTYEVCWTDDDGLRRSCGLYC